ncbi:MAG: ferric siderophore ABC transporter substrate-binding protein [Chryseobacterium sp.]|nr:ferric siderophore ABC transporter substrate-binding protein [Chryseobacterium sp.]
MNYALEHKREEKKDQTKSALITFLTFLLLFLLIYFYKIIQETPVQTKDVATTMLINFGDNQNGANLEEPANQEGSVTSVKKQVLLKPEVSEPQLALEKIITGNNIKVSAPKVEKAEKTAKKVSKTTTTKISTATVKKSTAKAQGDGKGTAAIGNLIRGRGNKTGSQGTDGTIGNAGDPLGGNGNGDSKIGVDRKLVGFIPGTMGRGGNQPSQNCSASGSIRVSYTVDKAGNVVSARRSGGVSDPCVVSTSVSWVRKYVKAERANTSSTGTYKIVF